MPRPVGESGAEQTGPLPVLNGETLKVLAEMGHAAALDTIGAESPKPPGQEEETAASQTPDAESTEPSDDDGEAVARPALTEAKG